MIEEQKERERIIAFFEGIVHNSTQWHHHKATLSINASEKIELVVSKR